MLITTYYSLCVLLTFFTLRSMSLMSTFFSHSIYMTFFEWLENSLSLSLSLSLSIYIYIYIWFCLFSYIFLGTNSSSSSFLSPIINNFHSPTISMLFRNLTLLCCCCFFFFFPYYLGNLMFVKSIEKSSYMYFSCLFLCFFFNGFA